MRISTILLYTLFLIPSFSSLHARHALYSIPYKHLELLAQGKKTPNFKDIDGTKDAFIKNIDGKFFVYSQGTRIRCYMNKDQVEKINNYLGRQIDCFFTTRRKVLKPEEIAAIAAAVAGAVIAGPVGFTGLAALAAPAAFFLGAQPLLLAGSLFYGTGGAITYALGPFLSANFAVAGAGVATLAAATAKFASVATPFLISASTAAGISLAQKSVALLIHGLNGSRITFEKIGAAVGLSLSSSLAGAAFSSVAADLSAVAHTAAAEGSGIALSKQRAEQLRKKYEKGGADYTNYYMGKVTWLSALVRFNLAEMGQRGRLFVQYRLPGDRLSKNRYYINRTLVSYRMSKDKKQREKVWHALYRSDFSHCYKKTKCETLKKEDDKKLCMFVQQVCQRSAFKYWGRTNALFKLLSPLGNKKDRVFLPDGVEVYATKSYVDVFLQQGKGG